MAKMIENQGKMTQKQLTRPLPTQDETAEGRQVRRQKLSLDYMDSLAEQYDKDIGLYSLFAEIPVREPDGTLITTEDILRCRRSGDADNPITIDVEPVNQQQLRELRTKYFVDNKKRNESKTKPCKVQSQGTFFPKVGGQHSKNQTTSRTTKGISQTKSSYGQKKLESSNSSGSVTITSDDEKLMQHTNGT